MVKPSLPHHGPSIVGTTVPIVPPSQSMVLISSAYHADIFSRSRLTFKNTVHERITDKWHSTVVQCSHAVPAHHEDDAPLRCGATAAEQLHGDSDPKHVSVGAGY